MVTIFRAIVLLAAGLVALSACTRGGSKDDGRSAEDLEKRACACDTTECLDRVYGDLRDYGDRLHRTYELKGNVPADVQRALGKASRCVRELQDRFPEHSLPRLPIGHVDQKRPE